ncbi:MAG: hypothetical protein HY914_08135 [Desulfomonile tiedjei]|nr:hypothetical protein [Desulfomonile tiedjei]
MNIFSSSGYPSTDSSGDNTIIESDRETHGRFAVQGHPLEDPMARPVLQRPHLPTGLPEGDIVQYDGEDEHLALLRSFDMVFQLQQRSEEIRAHFDRIDGILLSSRTVAALVERVVAYVENNMDLVTARLLFRAEHAIASAFRFETPRGMGMLPPTLLENESLKGGEPYVLDDPSGDLGQSIFGSVAGSLASAAVANLYTDADEQLGLLCLGSDDPYRYCCGMNTDLIASLADRISLGITNAWDHETRTRRALLSRAEGVYSEAFFREYLRKEFNRSWRSFQPFALMALVWGPFTVAGDPDPCSSDDLLTLIRASVRSADVVAEGETVDLWILLPDADIDGARSCAERIVAAAGEAFSHEPEIHIGITAFAREATAMPMLLNAAKSALSKALEQDDNPIAIQNVTLM